LHGGRAGWGGVVRYSSRTRTGANSIAWWKGRVERNGVLFAHVPEPFCVYGGRTRWKRKVFFMHTRSKSFALRKVRTVYVSHTYRDLRLQVKGHSGCNCSTLVEGLTQFFLRVQYFPTLQVLPVTCGSSDLAGVACACGSSDLADVACDPRKLRPCRCCP
jgi:hypothetical protein